VKYRRLGNTGLEVSEIGFGAWGIGGGSYGDVDEKESLAALDVAFDSGITFYDTSNLYGGGRSEELIGAAFKTKRDQVFIATKGGTLPHSGFHMPQDFSAKHLRDALAGSLKRLQTDYVDLYQLHSPSLNALESDETVEALVSFKKEGLIREYGISARSPMDAKIAIEKYGFPAVQVNFNLIDQRAMECGLYELAKKKGVGIINRTPLVFGFLTGTISASSSFQEGDHRTNWPKDQISRWANASQLFDFIGDGRRRTRVQVAIRYCLDHDAVSTVIPGMLNVAQVCENVGASDVPPLSDEEMARIAEIYKTYDFYDGSAKNRGKQ
jgi:aryl-alcohol dehydrogenase-like predicted oxidoreductase